MNVLPKKERIRKQGGGRKKKIDEDKNILKIIEEIVSPHTMGDPMKTLLWTNKSLRNIFDSKKIIDYRRWWRE